ncbi:energy-coupling factor ABC transporter ATP-binding protein [Azospirillum rugosum]|uniref:Biotin transport system ATP-binding protein n=1 Tax=Azospirillum rugosum TaxID=416170 RepID=A0ABS4SU32_9PROT|nr:ABC transporter ATP-binding protein [Azospirillum rugosum]MBP2296049.1 biotin transport system ATP-binding protein [Azospirillum rugosum]MDQ0529639.1 biotin transport system ATP-binding protein [Azospirillum rugosum]
MIELRNVRHRYGEREVLRGIDLTLAERRVAIVGSNGSGKSTLARLLNGLLLPDEGRVLVDGLDTRSDARAVRRKVGFVFQDPDVQIVYPTVAEDIAFGLKNLRLPRDEIARRVDAVMARFGLTEHRDWPAHRLSGGQKQLLAIASVLVLDPAYVVFDEPTTLLDLRNRRRIAGVIRDLPQTALLISHDLDLVAEAERVIVLDEGRVVADDAPAAAIAAYVARMG